MVELLEKGNLANRGAGHAFVLGLETDALQGDDFVRLLVLGLVNDAVRALSELLDVAVAVHGGCCFCLRGLLVLLLLLLGDVVFVSAQRRREKGLSAIIA